MLRLVWQFSGIRTKEKNYVKTFLSLPKDTVVAKVQVAKLNREKYNFPSKVYVYTDVYFEDDCFDSP